MDLIHVKSEQTLYYYTDSQKHYKTARNIKKWNKQS